MKKRVFRVIMASLAAGVIIAAVLYLLWKNGAFLPRWIEWQNETVFDTSGKYCAVLKGKNLRLTYDNSQIWASPRDVKVQDVSFADIDSDSEDELVLLCWRKGRYGKDRPFWVKKNDKDWSQHIFVYECSGDKIHAKWMSSYMGFEAAKIEKTSKGRIFLTELDGGVSCWVWDSWGFTKLMKIN